MNAEGIGFGLLSAVILSLPLCVTVHLAFLWFRATKWRSARQRGFKRALVVALLVFGAPYTLANVIDAATHASGTHWGKALVSIYFGYFLILAASVIVAYGVSFTVEAEKYEK